MLCILQALQELEQLKSDDYAGLAALIAYANAFQKSPVRLDPRLISTAFCHAFQLTLRLKGVTLPFALRREQTGTTCARFRSR